MSSSPALAVTVSRTISAAPETLFALVSDVTRMGEWSPETTNAAWLGDATAPEVGARFKGSNAIGKVKWSTKPTITAVVPAREFSFKVPGSREPSGPTGSNRPTAEPWSRNRSARNDVHRCRFGSCSAAPASPIEPTTFAWA